MVFILFHMFSIFLSTTVSVGRCSQEAYAVYFKLRKHSLKRVDHTMEENQVFIINLLHL